MASGAGESRAVYCGEVPKRCLFPKGTWVLRSLLMISGVSPQKKVGFFFFSGAWGHLHPTVVLAQDQVPTLMGWFSCWGQ